MNHLTCISKVIIISFLLIIMNAVNAEDKKNEQIWNFKVYLDDTPIGYHHFELTHNNEQKQLLSRAQFNVKLFFIPIFSYDHENTEVWHKQCLKQLKSQTNNNGENHFVSLENNNNNTIIETSKGKQTYNHCIRSFAYWNPELLKTNQALNTQTGELVDITFKYIGPDKITFNEQLIDTEHYRLLGENLDISLWYSKNKNWLALKTKTIKGQTIYYQLQDDV